jgi:diguanylate cyclase (GGDEF)-like protein/PAS domain S-box-containing protein
MAVTSKTETSKPSETDVSDQIKHLTAENSRLRMQFDSTAKQVQELNEFIQIMLNLSPFSICIIQNDQWIYINKAFYETVGYTPKQLRDILPWSFVFEADRQHVRKSVRAMLEGQAESFFMFRLMTGEEKIKWILGSVAYIHMNGKRAVLGNFVDLTEGRVMQLAYNDTLTGLPNRKLMMDRLEQALVAAKRRSSSLGILFIDLDGFKDVNDRYGHGEGDKLLIEVANGLKDVVRRENDTISRIGGDEFIILLTDISQRDHIELIIRHLFERFAAPVPIPGKDLKIPVAFSVGIAVFPEHGEDSDTLIRHADEAMYHIKKTPGKNGFHFYQP